MQSFCRALAELWYFEGCHVDSAITYRAQLFFNPIKSKLDNFLNQLKASLAKFEIWDPNVMDHSYLGSIKMIYSKA